jgi:hypothetical protein
MGRRAHTPDPGLRRQVETMAAYGLPETTSPASSTFDPKTLRPPPAQSYAGNSANTALSLQEYEIIRVSLQLCN